MLKVLRKEENVNQAKPRVSPTNLSEGTGNHTTSNSVTSVHTIKITTVSHLIGSRLSITFARHAIPTCICLNNKKSFLPDTLTMIVSAHVRYAT